MILVELVEMDNVIAEKEPDVLRGKEAVVCSKYKIVDKKVKLAVGPLPVNSRHTRKEVSRSNTSKVRGYWT